MTVKQKEARAELPRCIEYFQMLAQDSKHHLREIEYEIASATVDLIFAKDSFVETDFSVIASCVNGIIGREHSDGSGWFAFQLEVSRFFYSFGYNSNWNSTTGEFTFWKDNTRFQKWLTRT